jgi:3-oxoadipate enol-lactonase
VNATIETMEIAMPDGAVAGARFCGKAGPALVFVHGVGSTAAIWDRQLVAFGNYFRCAAIELRGNGALTDSDPSLITREGFAADVLAIAQACGFERFTLVGCSLGGVVAFELWQRAPERIDAMVLVGSFARYPDAQRYADGVKAAATAAGDMRTFAQARAGKLGLPPERLTETIEQMAVKSVPCYLASTQATWTGDYRSILSSISVPTLVVCGEHDAIAPYVLSEEIATGIPAAQLAVLAGAGHVSNADAPAAFDALLRDFLAKHPS